MEEKIGVFICSGYGIAEALDLEALSAVATNELSLPFCKVVDTCEGPGLEAILQDIQTESLTKVVIAGISPRRFSDGAFPEGVIVEPVGLREQVVWALPPNDEDTQMAAEDYIRMYVAKVKGMEHLEPFLSEEEINKDILVVGGGVAGLTSALEAAKAGYGVKLVEQAGELGGWLAKQHKSIPTKPPFKELEETGTQRLNRFDEYIKNDVAKTADAARKMVDTAKVEIEGADIDSTGGFEESPLIKPYLHSGFELKPSPILEEPENRTDFRSSVNRNYEVNSFRPYTQVFTKKHGFISNLSILDLLFNEGPNAELYLKKQNL